MASITSLTPQPFSQHSTQGVLSSRHAELDTELLKDSLPTRIAGFDLAQPQLRGKPASTLIDGLSRHLIDTGKASEPTANRVACQLLAKLAPEFLLRDIPASVTFGSVSCVHKGIYHNDLQLKNFLYSAKDKKVYPVDIQALDLEVMAGDAFLRDMTLGDYQRKKTRLQSEFDELVVTRSR
ncbi:MAG: hypothetical protein CFE47_15110 [Pseudomonas sp. PGPPP1]|uniref:hypothetical protein n=1 Tax=Pseudomonas sp. PGPPP1 TaxID=2015553 RepID=UPI000BD5D209|nr:hypothetical protein [Pseudomonas sp. PGPPP1]OYU06659.1 MAG: hypothetical protein CFE47_15110 [Pseudomonas sp. PGPPP1]